MSQHDYDLANASGSSFRADANNALAAIVSQNSGAAAPATTFAYERWADTTNTQVKRRNAANSAWVLDGTLAETFVSSKSGAYTVVAGDFQKLFVCTSTFSLALTAAATLGDGFWCWVRNDGTGIVTIDPSGSEQVDGATTQNLYAGEGCLLYCTGSAWKTVGRRQAGPVFSAYVAGATAMTAGAFVKCQFNAEDYDLRNEFDAATNYRWTATLNGKVRANFFATLAAISDTKQWTVGLYKNGVLYKQCSAVPAGATSEVCAGGSVELDIVATDYLEVYGYNGDSVSQNLSTTQAKSHFSVSYV